MRAWRERADLQAARRAVFSARVSSAASALTEGRLRRALGRWREVHGSARVAAIGWARAGGHARRIVLMKFWRTWVAARDFQVHDGWIYRKLWNFLKIFWRAWVAARGFQLRAAQVGGKYCEGCRGTFRGSSGAPAWPRESFQVRAAQVEHVRGTF